MRLEPTLPPPNMHPPRAEAARIATGARVEVRTCAHAATLAPVALVVMLAACAGERSQQVALEPGAAMDRAWVTGPAAAALNASGQFALAARSPQTPEEISGAQAAALATAYARNDGRQLQRQWEVDRGGPIAVDALAACGPVLYAATPYAALPSTVQPNVRKLVAAHWLVEMCDAGVPAVSISVSALAGDVALAGGKIASQTHGDFFSVGIPTAMASSRVTPEAAAKAAAQATGRRVALVPELVAPARPYAPQLAKWRVVLDAPVNVRGAQSGTTYQAREVYVGFEDTWHASATQATAPTVGGSTIASAAAATSGAEVTTLIDHGATTQTPGTAVAVATRPTYATRFERIEVLP